MRSLLLLPLIVIAGTPPPAKIEEKICGTTDIRHSNQIHLLDGCTLVDGNLIIIFPIAYDDEPSKEEIENLSFPMLREVTGFVFLHVLEWVKSLNKLFPNLTVIRGSRLFLNYALVINDCEHLEEITLRNLLRISRGSMRLGGTLTNLCFPRKIDFEQIVMNGRVILPRKSLNRSMCKIDDFKCDDCGPKGNCWHNGACQRFKKSYYVRNDKSSEDNKCHELCLGACWSTSASGCYVCQDISEDSVCVRSCSAERFLNVDSRRCITRKECSRLGKKIYNKECLSACPSNYTEQFNEETQDTVCVPCVKKCPRLCDFPEIRSVSQLEEIGPGCTTVTSSLEINIMDDINNLTAELHLYLGDIEEIYGGLKIHRSTPVTSLTFLNKLRRVHGMKNHTDSSFTVRIFENQNLQSFFDLRLRNGTKLEVKTGSVLIYNNIMLCDNEINSFRALIEPNSGKERKLDYIWNNGHLRACKNKFIKTYFQVLGHDECEISWEDLQIPKNRNKKEGAYILQYVAIDDSEIKELDENVLFERSSCSDYGWKTVMLNEENYSLKEQNGKKFYSHVLRGLKQYTDYAFTIQPQGYGASEVNRFQTLMNVPSRVAKVSTPIKSSSSILLEWTVVPRENDIIKQFLIYVFESRLELENLDRRNYCTFPITHEPVTTETNAEMEFSAIPTDKETCCEKCCTDEKKRRERREKEDDNFRENLSDYALAEMKMDRESHREKMTNRPGFLSKFRMEGSDRSLSIPDLKVFTYYCFHIYACTNDRKCSDYEMHCDRTAHEENFDQVYLKFTTNQFLRDTFRVHFEEPLATNGAIINYLIEIREKVGNETRLVKSDCITRKEHETKKYFYTVSELAEGDYTIRVAAVSLAQQGAFTNWHLFKVIRPKEEKPIGLIMIGVGFLLALTAGAGISYYYKHRIFRALRRNNEAALLLREMEPTDFHEVSLNHRGEHSNASDNE